MTILLVLPTPTILTPSLMPVRLAMAQIARKCAFRSSPDNLPPLSGANIVWFLSESHGPPR